MWVQFRYDLNRPLVSIKLVNPTDGKEFDCLARGFRRDNDDGKL